MAKEENREETMQTFNKAEVVGKLKILNLEKETVEDKKTKEKKDVIKGSITIQYGTEDDEQVEVKVYTYKLTKKGDVSKGYSLLSQLMEDGVTVAKAKEMTLKALKNAEESEDGSEPETFEPTIIRLSGNGGFSPKLELNEYHPENGNYSCKPEISLGFSSPVLDSDTSENFKGEFDNIIFLHKAPKMGKNKDGDETGKLVVEGLYINYKNQVKPLTFVVADEELIEGMEDLDKGETINVWGKIKIARIVNVKVKKSGFGGKGKTEEEVRYVSELLVTGGEAIEEDDKRWVDPAFIKKALVERETFLEELAKGSDKKEKSNKFKGKKSKDDLPF